jgi:hypothetical protein
LRKDGRSSAADEVAARINGAQAAIFGDHHQPSSARESDQASRSLLALGRRHSSRLVLVGITFPHPWSEKLSLARAARTH